MAEQTAFHITAFFNAAAYVIAIIFILSGADDLIQSGVYWVRAIRRWWTVRPARRLTLERLDAREQQKIALVIPAWHEEAVIYRMLRNTCETARYRNYDVFVGTYSNDPGTVSEVERAAREFGRIHNVTNPQPGPTTKAQNLNAIFEGIRDYEQQTGLRYEIIVTHDAEDIVHPLAFLVFNYLIPRKDLIQLPVFPLPAPLRDVTHWTYADEFAAAHLRELPVREFMRGFVPSAGVGTAYTRRTFALMSLYHRGQIFPLRSMTEDYMLGLRVRLAGLRAAFILLRLPMPGMAGHRSARRAGWVATQAAFPRTLEAAIRQKTRWNYGIALQSWDEEGWPGGLGVRLNLLHDRKVIMTSPASFLSYVVLLFAVLHELVLRRQNPALPAFAGPDTVLWVLVWVATLLMVWRFVQRFVAVWRVYGVLPAVTSIPRAAWGNYINFIAIMRAFHQFFAARRGRPVTWDKTAHEFPISTGFQPASIIAAHDHAPGIRPSELRRGTGQEPAHGWRDDTGVAALDRDLRSSDASTTLDAMRRIPKALGDHFLPLLGTLSNADSWQVRAHACRVMGFLGLPAAVSALTQAATNADWVVRANAIGALAKLGRAGEQALLALLQGPDRYAGELALLVLEQHGVVDRNLERLRTSKPAEVRAMRQFFEILQKFGPSRLAGEMLTAPAELTPASPPARVTDRQLTQVP